MSQILQTVGSTGARSQVLSTLLGDLITYDPSGNLLTCDTSAPGTTRERQGGRAQPRAAERARWAASTLNLGDVSVHGSSTAATPAVATSPASRATATAVATAVPNVTSVHTGEYWAGPLSVVALVAMGLAGLGLIARRRVVSLARSFPPFARRRGGQ